MTDDELINDFVSMVAKGEITFDKIRPMLEERGFDKLRIKQIVRRVDDEIQKSLLTKSNSSSVNQVILHRSRTFGYWCGTYNRLFCRAVFFGQQLHGYFCLRLPYRRARPDRGGMRRKKKKNLTQGTDALNRRFQLRDKRDNDQ